MINGARRGETRGAGRSRPNGDDPVRLSWFESSRPTLSGEKWNPETLGSNTNNF